MRAPGDDLPNLVKDARGPTAVEYAVILALLAVICLLTVASRPDPAKNTWEAKPSMIGGPDRSDAGG